MSIITVLTWMMFIGLFPLCIFWFRRAYLIGVKKDYSYVALKRGVPPENPEKYAKFALAINLIAATVIAVTILFIIIDGLHYDKWTAIAGTTLWVKLFADFVLSRQARIKLWKK